MVVLKEIQNVFSKEMSLTNIIILLLSEDDEYVDYIQELMENILILGEC